MNALHFLLDPHVNRSEFGRAVRLLTSLMYTTMLAICTTSHCSSIILHRWKVLEGMDSTSTVFTVRDSQRVLQILYRGNRLQELLGAYVEMGRRKNPEKALGADEISIDQDRAVARLTKKYHGTRGDSYGSVTC